MSISVIILVEEYRWNKLQNQNIQRPYHTAHTLMRIALESKAGAKR